MTVDPVAGLGLNDAETPLGRLEALKATLPLNPFCPVIVMVAVLELPCVIVIDPTELERVKLPAAVPFS